MAKKRAGDDDADWRDSLFTAPPRAFVTERKRIADALKAAGRADEARVAARMKRPTASVWAVNQLARRAPDELAELLALGGALRASERTLLRGGSADDFMAEARTARQKVSALARRAEALLGEAGQTKATLALGRKISQTLHAASLGDDDTRARLRAGRLEHDLAPPLGFGGESADLSSALAASVGARPKTQAAHAERKRAAVERKRAAVDRAAADAESDTARARARDGSAAGRSHPALAQTKSADRQAADARQRAADVRRRAAADRKRAAAAVRDERRAQAAARKQSAARARAVAAADRAVVEHKRAVDKARAAVERAEVELRAAKDALADAETAAAAAHRAAAEESPS